MSVVRENSDPALKDAIDRLEIEGCFTCGGKLEYPFVAWSGVTGAIGLHKDCAAHFFLALGRDIHELKDEILRTPNN